MEKFDPGQPQIDYLRKTPLTPKMSFNRLLSFFLLSLLLVEAAISQRLYEPEIRDPVTEKWRYTHIEMLDGKGIRTILRDSSGDYWFGVNNGIIHYDGLNFTLVGAAQGLEEKTVYQLLETKNGLIAILDHSIYQKDGAGWRKVMDIPEYASGRTFAVSKSPGEEVLISFSHGFFKIRGNSWSIYTPSAYFGDYRVEGDFTFHDLPEQPADYAYTDIIRVANDQFWLAVTTGKNTGDIMQLKLDRLGSIIPSSMAWLSKIHSKKFGEGQRLLATNNGEIWVTNSTTDIGLLIYKNGKWSSRSFNKLFGEDEYAYSITQTGDGKVVIGALGNVYSYDGKNWVRLAAPEFEIPASQVLVMSDISSGELWILGVQSKVFRIDLTEQRWITYTDLNYEDEDSKGNKWFLHKDDKIVVKGPNNWTYLDKRDGILDTPTRVFITSQGQVWLIGSHDGVAATSYHNGKKWVTDTHPYLSWGFDFRSVYEDKNGSIWFGGGVDNIPDLGQKGGLLQLINPLESTKKWIHHAAGDNGLSQSNVYGIAQSADGAIWIGGTRLSYYKDGLWNKSSNELLDNFINIVYSSGDELMVGSRYYGLYVQDDDSWVNYQVKDGLSSNTIADILAADNGIYVATDKDISHFDGATWSNSIFPAEMSIRNEGGSLKKSVDGTIWINKSKREWKRRALVRPSEQAFTNFLALGYRSSKQAPETWMEIYDDEVDDSGNTFIQWKGRDYLFETRSESLQYAYRMNGGEWSGFSPQTHVTLNGLADGDYTFEVKARDLDMNEDASPATVQFTVLPPVWKQQWFIFMVLAFISVLAIFEVRIVQKKNKLAALNKTLESHQAELEANNELLEDRNTEIINQRDRLQHLIKKNDTLSRAKLQFFTNITHEFRTPLTLIAGPIQQLQNKEYPESEKAQLFSIVNKNINRLQKLINQLLEFRKMQTSSLGLFLRKADLVRFVGEIADIFNNLAEQRSIHFEFHSDVHQRTIYFDQDKMEKIIYNILSNAFKYTKGSGDISIRLAQVPDAHFISIEIKDSGIGIPQDKLETIFNRFNTSEASEDSMGLGLAYTRELVEKHFGQIQISSEEGAGTTVQLLIPDNLNTALNGIGNDAEKGNGTAEKAQDMKKDRNLELLINGAPKTLPDGAPLVLVVEDNEDMRHFLRTLLAGRYRVMEAGDGQQALEILNEEDIDLMVSDVMMPEVDGLALCDRVKRELRTSHVPIILLSAKNMQQDVSKGYLHGADDYMAKPFEPEHLILKIQNILNSREALKRRFNDQFSFNPKEVKLESGDEKLLKKLMGILEENISDSEFDVNRMCEMVNLSHMQFIRKVRHLTGKKPVEILKSYRLKRAKQLLAQNKSNVSEVAYMVGYDVPNSFARAFKQEFGISPSEFVKNESEPTPSYQPTS